MSFYSDNSVPLLFEQHHERIQSRKKRSRKCCIVLFLFVFIIAGYLFYLYRSSNFYEPSGFLRIPHKFSVERHNNIFSKTFGLYDESDGKHIPIGEIKVPFFSTTFHLLNNQQLLNMTLFISHTSGVHGYLHNYNDPRCILMLQQQFSDQFVESREKFVLYSPDNIKLAETNWVSIDENIFKISNASSGQIIAVIKKQPYGQDAHVEVFDDSLIPRATFVFMAALA
eukprot:TRINITY_DN11810_c0_g1_i1.p1 TRINITY_DN11810_c0_g1~~TRINITY_DN11810_c0_g1_i1.p1  ORF type:complete len:226 (-),score=44.45 TRINITY_DN11810_c0_g1_i1:96-773(-)